MQMNLSVLLGAVAVACMSVPAMSQDNYPSRPIRLIVPYNAGGAGDAMARALGKVISEDLAQQVVVDNKPGASGMIGTAAVAKAKGDPYTLLLGSSAELTINPSLYKSVSYRVSDFQPVAFAGKLPLVLVTGVNNPISSVQQLVDVAKKRPGELSFASAGGGQTAHLAMEVVMQKTGTRMLHVPYKGGSEAVLAAVSGQADFFFSGLPPALPQITSGKLKAIAMSTTDRASQLPNVPTMAESGVPGFDIYNWFAVFAPADVPQPIIEKLHASIHKALETAEVRNVWARQGIVNQPMKPAELGAFVTAESQKYRQLIQSTNVTVE